MQDYLASIEKLRRDAAEAALIRDLAADQTKREMFDRLYQHLNRLADEVEKAMNGPEATKNRALGEAAYFWELDLPRGSEVAALLMAATFMTKRISPVSVCVGKVRDLGNHDMSSGPNLKMITHLITEHGEAAQCAWPLRREL